MNHNVFFHQKTNGSWIPSACFIDSESTVVDDHIRSGPMKHLFRGHSVTGFEDASNCYARGHFACSKVIRERSLLNLRRSIEQIDILNTIQTFAGLSGGTGSGFNSSLFIALRDIYPNVSFDLHAIFPSPQKQDTVTEPYNAILASAGFSEIFAIQYLYDNEGLEACISQCRDKSESITFSDYNHILSLVPSSLSACCRWGPGSSQKSIGINLVPFPGVNTVASAIVPILHHQSPRVISEHSILAEAFLNRCEMAKIDTFQGKYISTVLLYRGSPRIPTEYHKMIRERVEFVDWVSTGIKYEICTQPMRMNYKTTPSNKRYLAPKISLAKICNHTNITTGMLNHILTRYNSLLDKRAFVHWYIQEGMEEGEFSEAQERVESVIENVRDILNRGPTE
jgi:tubulin alpha